MVIVVVMGSVGFQLTAEDVWVGIEGHSGMLER